MTNEQKFSVIQRNSPSLATVVLAVGSSITLYSFYEYFSSGGAVSGSALGFVYGLPLLLLGFALKYAELAPIPIESSENAKKWRDKIATSVQKQILKDVTRYRYGNETHLQDVMKALGLVVRGKQCPSLEKVVEKCIEMEKGKHGYQLGLLFHSPTTPFSMWKDRVEQMNRFFGPNISCQVQEMEGNRIQLLMTSERTIAL
eukprot:jgi/Galph1/1474/GphlegSOOS_G158.1